MIEQIICVHVSWQVHAGNLDGALVNHLLLQT